MFPVSSNSRCHSDEITIEFIGMTRLMDNRMFYRKPHHNISDHTKHRSVYLEYLLRDYFPHYGYPDLWIISPPFHHVAWVYTLEQYAVVMGQFARMLDDFMPASTRLLFLTDSRECPARWSRQFLDDFRNVSSLSKNEILHAMNQIMFNALQDKLTRAGNVMGFFDMGSLSCPFTCRWHDDGAHMIQGWCDLQIKLIFQYLSKM